ncbi:MAG: DUF4173 domain-containing protein [Chloroflexi bacterium]|nr:MAG: DUF4173 domain-containing protein [Chloroflexota bacterium]
MSSTELVTEGVAPVPRAVDRALARRAARVLLVATAFGLLVQFLFIEALLGVNFPITIAALLLAGWAASDRTSAVPDRADLWIVPTAVVLAAFVAVRGDSSLVALDVLGSLGLTGLALASFGGLAIVRRPFERILQLGGRIAGWAMIGAANAISSARWLAPEQGRNAVSRGAPLLRGILLAIPLVLIFAFLFSQADAVFAEYAGNLFDWELDIDELVTRGLTAGIAAWAAAGLLGLIALRDRSTDPPLTSVPARIRVGTTECLIVLLALNGLFAAFVVIQAAYLFGGLDTLEATGMSYAEYARRGFFELLAVAFLVAGLILMLEALIKQRSRAYVVSAIVLVVLTMVILASSLLRLRLYQEAYGWTELRFYVLAAIGWLAIGAVGGVAALATNRTKWLLHGMVVLSVVFGIGFNLIGPVRFIAEQNVARAIDPSLVPPGGETGLDVYYLSSLGTDADIVMAESLADLPQPERAEVADALEHTARDLRSNPYLDAWQGWNLSRTTIAEQLGVE